MLQTVRGGMYLVFPMSCRNSVVYFLSIFACGFFLSVLNYRNKSELELVNVRVF